MNNEPFPDFGVRYRVLTPDEKFEPSAEPLVFDRVESAWAYAARTAARNPDHESTDPLTVVGDLIDVDEPGVMWGWAVHRWAKTMQHNKTTAHRLSKKWGNGITLTHHDAMDQTWSKVSTLLVQDMLRYTDFHGVDAAVVVSKPGATPQVWLGLIVDCTSSGQVTFADAQVLELEWAEQISVHFG